ncbi:MAG: alpha/beta hydrolase [Chroococcidiopsidaceae cyanobacterium CP_BM_RX_35]|nr:alpha/beta hydrolase [Chroococcidiopsidaceae cyanobacterium CP_BM_RX_35]
MTPGIGGSVKQYLWHYQGQQFPVVYETLGQGTPLLLLPAFSTVSGRSEMRGLAERLAPQFQVFALDWLGFGQSARPALHYQPALYHQLLQDFVKATFDRPISVVAAGHAAGYVLQLAQQQSSVWSRIVLVAPTWRGPLPTMGAPSTLATTVRQVVRSPLVGQLLYYLNTRPSFLSLMYRRHVFVDAAKLTPAFVQQKYQITQQAGARFAPAAFVTGALDPVSNRADFLAQVESISIPIMVLIGKQAPPMSKAEMESLSEILGVETRKLTGSLGLHEENAAAVAEVILPFLQSPPSNV